MIRETIHLCKYKQGSVLYVVIGGSIQLVLDAKDLEKCKQEFYDYPKEVVIRYWSERSDIPYWRNKIAKIKYRRSCLDKYIPFKIEDDDDATAISDFELDDDLIDIETGEVVASKGQTLQKKDTQKLNGTYRYKA